MTIGARLKKSVSRLGYVKAFLDDRAVASIAPSSPALVARVIKALDLEKARTIVEYGAARGVITEAILRNMRPDARLVAVELNEKLYAELRAGVKDVRLIPVQGDVRRIDRILKKVGLSTADRVVSGVPFSFFAEAERDELLARTASLLNPGGRFVAYQVTTHLSSLLKRHFRKVDVQLEVRSLPPQFVFTALK